MEDTLTNQFMNIMRDSAINELVIKTIDKYQPNVGQMLDGDSVKPLDDEAKKNILEVKEGVIEAINLVHDLLSSHNIIAVNPMTYAQFLLELTREYINIPLYDNLQNLSQSEVDALVISHMAATDIATMRAGVIQYNYLSQAEPILTAELVKKQFEEIDDAIIKDAYKTLLEKQIKEAIQPIN
jgi:hypothetical protein